MSELLHEWDATKIFHFLLTDWRQVNFLIFFKEKKNNLWSMKADRYGFRSCSVSYTLSIDIWRYLGPKMALSLIWFPQKIAACKLSDEGTTKYVIAKFKQSLFPRRCACIILYAIVRLYTWTLSNKKTGTKRNRNKWIETQNSLQKSFHKISNFTQNIITSKRCPSSGLYNLQNRKTISNLQMLNYF